MSMQDRWNERQNRKREEFGAYFGERQARIDRGEYQTGDVVNGYRLTKKGEWGTVKSPFSNAAKWMAVGGLILFPLAIVAVVLAAVGQSKNEAEADSAMTAAILVTVISVIALAVILFGMASTPTYPY